MVVLGLFLSHEQCSACDSYGSIKANMSLQIIVTQCGKDGLCTKLGQDPMVLKALDDRHLWPYSAKEHSLGKQ